MIDSWNYRDVTAACSVVNIVYSGYSQSKMVRHITIKLVATRGRTLNTVFSPSTRYCSLLTFQKQEVQILGKTINIVRYTADED